MAVRIERQPGSDLTRVILDEVTEIWFSFETPIAFRNHDGHAFVRRNEWGTKTARHLNTAGSSLGVHRDDRVDGELFEYTISLI
jgi:hypothetical protein